MISDYKWLQCYSDLMTQKTLFNLYLSGKLIRIIHVPFIKMSTCKTTPSKILLFCVSEDWYFAHQPLTFLAIERVTRRVQNKHKTSSSLHLPQPKAMLMSYQLPERKWLSYDNIIQYHWEVLTVWMGTIFKRPIIVAIEQELTTGMFVIILALIAVDHIVRYNWLLHQTSV